MKSFLDENFLLKSKVAQILYHDFAKIMPIIDYHNHLPPENIAENLQFKNITKVWLNGDHYKWRAMRTHGIDECYCTGSKSDWEKFEKWAATVPYTLRNPLYHWTHLELQRYFGIKDILSPASARKIYDTCNEKLNTPDYSVRNLLTKMNVKTLCTTDDPLDNLEYHQKIRNDNFQIRVLPAFRPDKAMGAETPQSLNEYINRLAQITDTAIENLESYLTALKMRHDYFAANGCTVSDHGLEYIYAEDYKDEEIALSSIRYEEIRCQIIQKFLSSNLPCCFVLHYGIMKRAGYNSII